MEGRMRGEVRVADHVVAVIASVAAQDIPGIVFKGGLYEEFSKRVGGKNSAKGIQVKLEEGETKIDMRVVVRYGLQIHQVCRALQAQVKQLVEQLTGIPVREINVRVEGIETA
ncbi:Asp23/Gls24 family envelope stress response protein [Brevibacillus sp. B_LB10_24]|uniref:Asp23/Gls24 family envelope stress response protein n=1 Tax=Brevibacillus sp. B_LB10_24 TaxID=3380645 RepID=UPI0038B9EF83